MGDGGWDGNGDGMGDMIDSFDDWRGLHAAFFFFFVLQPHELLLNFETCFEKNF